jgi:CRISPR-associated protein Csm4
MQTYSITIKPESAFGTPVSGDTFFGQLCWAVRNTYGEQRLQELLESYTNNKPFAIVSDAFPADFIPMPLIPGCKFKPVDERQRKQMKKRIWFPLQEINQPVHEWQQHGRTDEHMTDGKGQWKKTSIQPHNSIDRLTGTTGKTGFAPYTTQQIWYHSSVNLQCYILLDESRLDANELNTLITEIGLFGYGRDASIGLGKFTIKSFEKINLPEQTNANCCLTLSACAPQGLGYDSTQSYYQLMTRFGRHGDLAVHQKGKPFKNPVLLAKAGSVFKTKTAKAQWVGQGLGANGQLSKTIENTVQQGYAPVINLHLAESQESIQ